MFLKIGPKAAISTPYIHGSDRYYARTKTHYIIIVSVLPKVKIYEGRIVYMEEI